MRASSALFERTCVCLMSADVEAKSACVARLLEDWRGGQLSRGDVTAVETISHPGRPARPELVAPRGLTRRSTATASGRAALIHSLCHIEFNAINLALDAVYRFRDLPDDYYNDWLQVAQEEAFHFRLLRDHLVSLGYDYGDFPAHNGLWETALETAHDPLVRMALVPRVLEARGLDVTPGIMEKLRTAGDEEAVAILEIIHRDEIGHVAIGSRWFKFLCSQRGLPVEQTFADLVQTYLHGGIRKPLDHATRRRAGFSEAELAYLESAG